MSMVDGRKSLCSCPWVQIHVSEGKSCASNSVSHESVEGGPRVLRELDWRELGWRRLEKWEERGGLSVGTSPGSDGEKGKADPIEMDANRRVMSMVDAPAEEAGSEFGASRAVKKRGGSTADDA